MRWQCGHVAIKVCRFILSALDSVDIANCLSHAISVAGKKDREKKQKETRSVWNRPSA